MQRAVGVSSRSSSMILMIAGVKVNGAYYRDVLLKQQMLPDIRRMSGDFFIFQQHSAPAHRARDTIELLRRETSDSLDQMSGQRIHQTSIQLTRIWGLIQERIYQTAIRDIDDLKRRLTCVWAELKHSVIDKAIEQWNKADSLHLRKGTTL